MRRICGCTRTHVGCCHPLGSEAWWSCSLLPLLPRLLHSQSHSKSYRKLCPSALSAVPFLLVEIYTLGIPHSSLSFLMGQFHRDQSESQFDLRKSLRCCSVVLISIYAWGRQFWSTRRVLRLVFGWCGIGIYFWKWGWPYISNLLVNGKSKGFE